MTKKKHRKSKAETTKILITMIIGVSLFDLQMSYVLALLGKDPLENLAISIIVNIILTFLVYATKAFFGKKEEEITRLKELQMEMEQRIKELEIQAGLRKEGEDDDGLERDGF
jgi:hypothetical protein